ncbi:hypothetical protein FPQ18DRAFT_406007 [Pyronema domesticum]|uniref:Uncharacterized protein n=1 Tax=Pyronema omphalodes (strain CBS 100304) TaxID=1076935 RepID=U4LPU7_PYROM|nr:hypothetical protein FPQ18DRAFT_406007 [Pyronema domesticum]CCX31340.1 Protein of unknown function [Pyronema omphalodes CBS 100304]
MRSERLVPLFTAVVIIGGFVAATFMMFRPNNNTYASRSFRYNGIDLNVPNYYSRPFGDSRCDIFCWLRWKKQLEGYDTFRLIKEQIEKDEEHVKWTQKEYRMSGYSSESWEYDWGYVMEGSASKEVPAKEIILGIVGVVVMLAL